MPGHVDNQGRLILMFNLSSHRPHGRPLEHVIAYMLWEVDMLVETEKLSHLRNGFLCIVNIEGFSLLKNMDMSAEGRRRSALLSGSIPNRIRTAWLIRGGWLARTLLSATKVVFPKKISKRFSMFKEADLVEHIPKVRRNIGRSFCGGN